MFGSRSKPLLALDLGASSLKAVQLKRARAGVEVTHLGLEAVPHGTVVDSMIARPEAMSEAIQRVCEAQNIKTRTVAGAVCGHSVIMKKISLVAANDHELVEAIEREAAQHIPFDLRDVNLDYQVLSQEAGGHVEVLLVAAKKDKIANYTSVITGAGKTPAVMDLDTLALVNCYAFNYQPAAESIVALLNVGASVMNIHIVRGATPLFSRDVSVGGHQYTDSLQKEFELSFADAEALKQGQGDGHIAEEARNGVLQQVTEILVLEIQKTLDYFRASAGGEHIERMLVAGGSGKVPGLLESLRLEFAVPVEMLNPFQRIVIREKSAAAQLVEANPAQYGVGVGLALRSFENL